MTILALWIVRRVSDHVPEFADYALRWCIVIEFDNAVRLPLDSGHYTLATYANACAREIKNSARPLQPNLPVLLMHYVPVSIAAFESDASGPGII